MKLIESIHVALRSLAANKLRALLTMLGIIIGVAAVIALMGIGRGAQQAITNQIQSMGTNLLFVQPGSINENGVRQAAGSAQTLTYEDALALANPQAAPAVTAVAPEVRTFGQVVYLGNNANTQIIGVTPDELSVRNLELADGDYIAAANVTGRSTVAVLGANVAEDLFPGESPVGQSVRINNISFRVIGVLAPKGGTGFGNQDDVVQVPLTTVLSRLQRGRFRGGNVVSSINVQVASGGQIDEAIQEIGDILRERHHLRNEPDDFSILNQQDLLATATQITGVLTAFLGGIAAISLIVGGIGIMNIMLVSVTERTREIGIRKAVGAKRRDILLQFLTEATILSIAGGLIGILLGTGVAKLISGIPFGGSTVNAVVAPDSVLLATIFSIAVGLFFGIYPATRAAALNPIDALRYE
ncbi:MAG: ABC transporter permease [Ardenticatenaceae bacterium]|nr:ABC transporter permease [Ardenticatenaceae bacterium]